MAALCFCTTRTTSALSAVLLLVLSSAQLSRVLRSLPTSAPTLHEPLTLQIELEKNTTTSSTSLQIVRQRSTSTSSIGLTMAAPSWFLDYASCKSLQEAWSDQNHRGDLFQRSQGESNRDEDICAAADVPERIWEATPPALRKLLLQPELLVEELPSRKIMFLGDSVSWQRLRSLSCILAEAGFLRVFTWTEEFAHQEHWVRGGLSFELHFRRSNWLRQAIQVLADTRPSQEFSVVVDAYAWYNNQTLWAHELEQFAGFMMAQGELRASMYMPEPLPQHFEAPDGLFNPLGNTKRCTPLREDLDWRSILFKEKTTECLAKVQLLPLRKIAAPLYFAHGKGHPLVVDCTHYCTPAVHVLSAALAHLIKTARTGQSLQVQEELPHGVV